MVLVVFLCGDAVEHQDFDFFVEDLEVEGFERGEDFEGLSEVLESVENGFYVWIILVIFGAIRNFFSVLRGGGALCNLIWAEILPVLLEFGELSFDGKINFVKEFLIKYEFKESQQK